MCYDIKVSLERQLKVARNFGDKASIDELEKKLLPYLNPIEREYYRVSGFDHPKVFLLLNGAQVDIAQWGLIPNWITSAEDAKQIRDKTLNARKESVEEKASFREAYNSRRAVLFIDGFFEHKHAFKKTFPYYIHSPQNSQLALACIYEEPHPFSADLKTFSILTESGKGIMCDIHNNPKLAEPRMPVLLDEKGIERWLNEKDVSINEINSDISLVAHTVKRFSGRPNAGNLPDSDEEFHYPEFNKGLFD